MKSYELSYLSCQRSETCIGEETTKQFLLAAALQEFSVIRYFVENKGLHPDTTLDGKPTALCYAALKQDHCLMMYLRKQGADINWIDRRGMTPLHYAALGGSDYCVAYLIQWGAAINLANHSGETPLALTQDKSHLRDCNELLRRHGATLYCHQNGVSCFH